MLDILIIGSGPAGITASIYARRANKNTMVLEGTLPGGQLMKTTDVENYPGFENGIMGPDLMNAMKKQAVNLGVIFEAKSAVSIEKNENIFSVKLNNGTILQSKSVICATGSTPLTLGIEGKFMGKGISTCATCDGAFFKNKDVCVIGGGNSALEEAIYLSAIAQKVYLIHRRNDFRGDKVLQDKVQEKSNIEIMTPYTVVNFDGNILLEKITIKNTITNEEKEIQLQGAFIAIGHKPNTQFLKNLIKLDNNGYVEQGVATEIKGLFVAGDMYDSKYRQAITSAGLGCMAAIDTIKFLDH